MDLAMRGLIHLLHYWIPSRRELVPFTTLSGHTPTTELGAPEMTTSCQKNKVYQYKQKRGSRYLQENTRSEVLQMNGEEMKRLIADDEDRVLLLRFPKGWGLWMDLGGALLYEVLRSDLFFFELNQEFWQEGDGWLKYPLPISGRCPILGADYPPPGKIPPQGRILRGKLRPL